jgi:hypothetical protein
MPNRFWTVWLLAGLIIAIGLVMDFWPESPRFVVEQPERQFDSLPVGETQNLTFLIRNRSSAPIRVVGAEFS